MRSAPLAVALACCPLLPAATDPAQVSAPSKARASIDGAIDLPLRLLELERIVSDSAQPLARRAELAAEADAIRERLIATKPADDRVPRWLVDRAGYALAQTAPDGADLAVLVGLATPEQRRKIKQSATTALGLLEQAATTSAGVVERVEGRVLDRADAGQAEEALERLVEVEQSQRIPLLTGLSRALMASVSQSENDRSTHATLALKALDACKPQSAAIQAARDVMIGLTLLNSGVNSDKARQAAEQRLRGAMAVQGADSATLQRARLGLIAGGFAIDAAQDDPSLSWPARLVIAEARLRQRLGGTTAGGLRRVELTPALAAEMLALGREPGDSPESTEARRALVYVKLGSAVDPRTATTALAPELAMARSVAMVRDGDPGGLVGLTALVDRAEADAELRADAAWEAAVALDRREPQNAPGEGGGAATLSKVSTTPRLPDQAGAPGQSLSATLADRRRRQSDLLARIVTEWPTSPRARAAALQIVSQSSTSQTLSSRVRLSEQPADPLAYRQALAFLDQAGVDPALSKADPASASDVGRYRVQRVRSELRGQSVLPAAQSSAVLDTLQRMPATSPEYAEVLEAIAESALPIQRGLTSVSARARRDTLERLVLALGVARTAEAAGLTLQLAETRLALGDVPGAVELLNALASLGDPEISIVAAAADPGESADGAMSNLSAGDRLRLGLAQAYRSSGQDQAAFVQLRALVLRHEQPPSGQGRGPARARAYWLGWCEMLEVLAIKEPGAGRASEILTQLRRLESIDAGLGGPGTLARLSKVRSVVLRGIELTPDPAARPASGEAPALSPAAQTPEARR